MLIISVGSVGKRKNYCKISAPDYLLQIIITKLQTVILSRQDSKITRNNAIKSYQREFVYELIGTNNDLRLCDSSKHSELSNSLHRKMFTYLFSLNFITIFLQQSSRKHVETLNALILRKHLNLDDLKNITVNKNFSGHLLPDTLMKVHNVPSKSFPALDTLILESKIICK